MIIKSSCTITYSAFFTAIDDSLAFLTQAGLLFGKCYTVQHKAG